MVLFGFDPQLSALAQDIHFSQFAVAPHNVNPCLVGLHPGDLRMATVYRDQYHSFLDKPYRSFTFLTDYKLKPFENCDFIDFGFDLKADKTGDLDFGTVQADVLVNFHKSLDKFGNHHLGFGFAAGYARRQMNVNPFEDFIDQVEYIPIEKFGFADVSAGILYSGKSLFGDQYYLGFGYFHINRPEQSDFLQPKGFISTQEPLYSRFVLHGGAVLAASKRIGVLPTFVYQIQGPAREFNFGAMLRYKYTELADDTQSSVYLGLQYRYADAIIGLVRYDVKGFTVIFSYDFTLSTLSEANRGFGAAELSITKVMNINKTKHCKNNDVFCPVF